MGFENKEGFGNLFTNDKKGNEKAPDRKGEIMLGGVVWEIAGWIKEGKNGKFLSLSGKPKRDNPAQEPAPKPAKPVTGGFDDLDSDLPF